MREVVCIFIVWRIVMIFWGGGLKKKYIFLITLKHLRYNFFSYSPAPLPQEVLTRLSQITWVQFSPKLLQNRLSKLSKFWNFFSIFKGCIKITLNFCSIIIDFPCSLPFFVENKCLGFIKSKQAFWKATYTMNTSNKWLISTEILKYN